MAGRKPIPYEPEYHNLAAMQAMRDGLTEAEGAKRLGISYTTWKLWKNQFPSFAAAIKEGKLPVDAAVESALLKRALGYTYTEVTVEREGGVAVKRKRIRKHVPGDVTAMIFWLKNRRPDNWRDVSRQELTGPNGKPLTATWADLMKEADAAERAHSKAEADTRSEGEN
jgi:hypothetical protein